jgi:hypothetical protein
MEGVLLSIGFFDRPFPSVFAMVIHGKEICLDGGK